MKTLQLTMLSMLFFCIALKPQISESQNSQSLEKKDMFYATMQTTDAQGLRINHPEAIQIIKSFNGYSAVCYLIMLQKSSTTKF
jgi:hypothetical protein